MQRLNRTLVSIAVILLVLIVSVGAIIALFINQSQPSTFSSFSLNAQGNAYDMTQNKSVFFYLTLAGNANGNIEKTIDLQIKSGNVNVAGYPYIAVASGESTLTPNSPNIELHLLVTATGYGLSPTSWTLQGTIGNISGNNANASVVLSAQQLSLPVENSPTLTNVTVSGTTALK